MGMTNKKQTKIYSFSKYLAKLNKQLSGEIILAKDISELHNDYNDSNSIILFDWDNLHAVRSAFSESNQDRLYICVDDDITPENRLYLLNNNIEFLTHTKFSKLTHDDFIHWVRHENYRVLIIENNQFEALKYSTILKNVKIEVKTVGLEVTVRDVIEIFKPDLVLLNLNDIEISKVAKIVNSVKSKSQELPVLFLNADNSTESRQVLNNQGISQVLTKPVNEDVFLDTVFDLIQGKILKHVHSCAIENDEPLKHIIRSKCHNELSSFISSYGNSDYATVIWFKVSNKFSIQRKIGLIGFRDVFEELANRLPDFDIEFSIKLLITDGIMAVACNRLTRSSIMEYIDKVKSWVANNYFIINNKDILCCLQAYVLTNISSKSNKKLLISEAERVMMNPSHSGEVVFIAESEERKNFYLTKTKLINAIRDKSFKWLYQSILSTKNTDSEVLQLMMRVITTDGKELKNLDYFNVANETGLLKLLDRYTLKHAMAVILDAQNKNIDRYILVNQIISDYDSLNHRKETLRSIKEHHIPDNHLIFQFRQDLTEDYLSQLSEIGTDIKETGISVCISEFDASDSAWEIAKRLQAQWIRLKPFEIDSEEMYADSPYYIGNTVKEAQNLGYKVIVPNIDSADFTAHIWNMNADFIHGNFIQSPVTDIKYIENQ